SDAGEETGVYDVKVVKLVRLAVGVEDRRRRVVTEAHRASLVSATSDRDVVLHVDVSRDQMVRVHAQMAQVLLDPVVELLQRLTVIRRIAQDDVAVPVQRNSV